MDGKVVLDEDATRCAFCNNYLSVAPVLATLAEDEVKYRCGRCTEIECKTYTRISCYEKVAKYLTFPCTYRQCEQQLQWGQVGDHEKACPFRTLPCPVFYQDCNETVQVSELQSHFESKHFRNIRYGTNIATLMKENEFVVCLLVQNKRQYIVYVCINQLEPSYVSVFSILPATDEKFNLELSSTNSSSSIVYRNQKILTFDERRHCLKCNERECYKKHHPHSLVYDKPGENSDVIVTNLKMASIIDLLERSESMTLTISLVEEEGSPQKKVKSENMQE